MSRFINAELELDSGSDSDSDSNLEELTSEQGIQINDFLNKFS